MNTVQYKDIFTRARELGAAKNVRIHPMAAFFTIIESLYPLYLAVSGQTNVSTLLAIFVVQSIVIGFFTWITLLRRRNIPMSMFFPIHYGIFHLVYCVFIFSAGSQLFGDVLYIAPVIVAALLFFVTHMIVYVNTVSFEDKIPTGTLLKFTYYRVTVAHVTIIFGSILSMATGGSLVPLVVFIIAKLLMDIHMLAKSRTLVVQ